MYVGMALVSLLLFVMQAFVVHAFCALCLSSAAISLIIYILGLHEVFAAFSVFARRLL